MILKGGQMTSGLNYSSVGAARGRARPTTSAWRDLAAGPILACLRAVHSLKKPPPGFRIPIFHDVPAHSAEAFGRLIDHLQSAHGTVSPIDAEAWLAGGTPTTADWRAPCLITFDDGFASNARVATESLDKIGLKALFFVCPGLIELSGDAQRDAIVKNLFQGRMSIGALDSDQRLMSWGELRELADAGHEIGCHTMTHRRLTGLNEAELKYEILDAADLLEQRMGRRTKWFAYPFGDIRSIDAPAMRMIASRFSYCRSGVRGINTANASPFGLLAEQLEPGATPAYARLVMEGGLDFRYRAARRELLKITSKLSGG